jgi:hypothetical protein
MIKCIMHEFKYGLALLERLGQNPFGTILIELVLMAHI